MIAYFSDKTRDAMGASEHPVFSRLMGCGKWNWTKWEHAGKSGILAHLDQTPLTVGMPEKTCPDGLVYFGYIKQPAQDDLARDNVPNSFAVELSCGRTIDIPLAIAAPKCLSFDGSGDDGHATEFGREAFRIWDNIELKKFPNDMECRKLIYLAINQTYKVTQELLTQLKWVADVDVVPIMLAISGRDPKSDAVAGNTLAQSAAAG